MISILLIDLAAVDGAVDTHSFEKVMLPDHRSGRSDFAENWVPGFQTYWLQVSDKVLAIEMTNNAT